MLIRQLQIGGLMKAISVDQLAEIYQKTAAERLSEFFAFLKYESISSEPAYRPQLLACADWLKSYISDIGFHTELWQTPGYPAIFAEWNGAGPDKPTLLIYNHYDVQPIDPLEDWLSPPFEPTVRDGNVYARGAQDNKGQCFYVLQALKILMQRDGHLPLNVKLIIEGEEECGSAGLAAILKEKKEQLKADFLAIVDLGIRKPTQPSLTLGIRGIVTMDVEVKASHTDLHSGMHGGLAFNPIHALVEVLAKLRDSSGKITVPGFYDDVVEISDEQIDALSLDFDGENYHTMFGIKATGGERSLQPLERNWLRPTLEINGIHGGYTAAGFKTVIPAKAIAKISCRLVPNQQPNKIGKLVAKFIEANAPEGVKIDVQVHPGGGPAVQTRPSSVGAKAFSEAFSEIYRTPCEFILEGASIPIVTALASASGSEVVLLGVGLPSDLIHAPNEHFGIDRLEKGCLVMARGIEILGKGAK